MAYPEEIKERARQLADGGQLPEQIADIFSKEVRDEKS
jgi:hypothetical protein